MTFNKSFFWPTFFLYLWGAGILSAIATDDPHYYFQGKDWSLIEWNKLDPVDWTSTRQWKKQLKIKEKTPHWEDWKRSLAHNEVLGRVLMCVGTCRLYRKHGFINVQHRSVIREGDEIKTFSDSYLWVYLLDGTMVRLSPDSSVSFREFNVTPDFFFFYTRLNEGNILWLGRNTHTLPQESLFETDRVFYPVRPIDANVIGDKVSPYEVLAKRIQENLQKGSKRPTKVFFVIPNGTLEGENISFESYYLVGKKGYFKVRDFFGENKKLRVHLRGYLNREVVEVGDHRWYYLGNDGREVDILEDVPRFFLTNEILTKRIPTLLVAREIFWEKYSKFLFTKDFKAKILAQQFGQRLWNEKDKEEMKKRVQFLVEFTRRVETTQLGNVKKLLENSHLISRFKMGTHYFSFALQKYLKDLTRDDDLQLMFQKNNRLWKYRHYRKLLSSGK